VPASKYHYNHIDKKCNSQNDKLCGFYIFFIVFKKNNEIFYDFFIKYKKITGKNVIFTHNFLKTLFFYFFVFDFLTLSEFTKFSASL